jgi:hypothetical protein
MKWILCPLLLSVPLAGCQHNEPPADPVSVRDSAGIRIVESAAPSGETAGWTLSATPALSIGEAEGSEESLLYRAHSALVLDDGGILISNSGTHEVRLYRRDGSFSRSFGAEGEGPGEFGGFSSMRLYFFAADSLAVTDGANLRLNLFSTAGHFDRSISPTVVEGYARPAIWGVFADGEWLAQMPKGSGSLGGNVGDRLESWFGFLRYAPDGSHATRLADVPGRPRIVNSLGGGAVHFPFVPLTPDPAFSVVGNDLLLSQGAEPEVRRIDRDGRVRSIVRWNQPRSPVRDIWSRFTEEFLAEVNEERRPAYARLLAMSDLPLPELVPAVEGIIVDGLGDVWVQEYRLPWQQARVWHVLSPDGTWLGDMTTPPGVTVYDIGQDYILGRHVDELGVERVVVYGLDRGGAS